jgi:hypothetical protein
MIRPLAFNFTFSAMVPHGFE